MQRYAETHYKFRLPWSPLFRRLPEMIVDAPWCAVPGQDPPLFLAVHDAHRFPVTLREVRVVVRAGGEMHLERRNLDLRLDQPFHWLDLPWPGPVVPGQNLVDVLFEVEDSKGHRHKFLNHSLPRLAPTSLDVLRLESAFPFPAGWTSGDLHCHTTWSEDPVEWGGDPATMNRAAKCMGMGFWAATDHSYDFAWKQPDYMVPTDPVAKFARFRASLPQDLPDEPVVLPAEEVSCGNRDGRNVHLIVIDHPEYLPGQGDGGRRWLDNRPDLSISQVLDRIRQSGAPAIAAHPRPGIGLAERVIFRRGDYDLSDLRDGLSGLQFWNGGNGNDFRNGKALWVADLLRGNRRQPIAGNDAHGDLNRATQVDLPLVSLRQTKSHRFGKARTWLHLDTQPNRANLRTALGGSAPTTLSDGPWLGLRIPGARDPQRRSPDGNIRLEARSLSEFGNLDKIRLFAHKRGDSSETLLLDSTSDSLEFEHTASMPGGLCYLRAELTTTKGFRALTDAIDFA
jgi:hypothetical protein